MNDCKKDADRKQHVKESQKRYLENWLHEWEIDSALRNLEEEGADDGQPHGDLLGTPAGNGAVVAVDQIRLLYPDCRATWHRPLYLALLDGDEKSGFLAAPFSRFDSPALPGELATGRTDARLRVLCLWNSAVFQSSRLRGGWMVDRLNPAELKDAMAVYRWIEQDDQIPFNLEERVGPGLHHPLDPRWDYREEELEFMESVGRAMNGERKGVSYELKETPRQYLSKAADHKENFDIG